MKNWREVPVAVGLLLAGLVPLGVAAEEQVDIQQVDIQLLHVNDIYQIGQGNTAGGLARFATLIKQLRKHNEALIVSFGGDTLSPSVASTEFKGAQMIAAWNALPLDVAVLGNHEFDFGPAVLQARIAASHFPWLAANVHQRDTDALFPGSSAYFIKQVDGFRLAFVGVITAATASNSRPGPDYAFDDAVATLCQQGRSLRQQGLADVVVALTHLDLAEDRLAAQHCQVDVVLGGHDHQPLAELVAGKPIFKAGADASHAVLATLTLDRRTRQVARIAWQLLPLDKTLAEDPELSALAGHYEQALQEKLAQVVGSTTTPLDARTATVRQQESAVAYWVADAFRAAMDAEVAVVNGGALRSDALIAPGPISKLDVKKLLPFENHVLKLEVSGQQLRAMFESISAQLGQVALGRFPHVSGMNIVFDVSQPAGQRVRELWIGGQAVDPSQHYSLAVSAYLAAGHDGYSPLKGARQLTPADLAPIETQVVIDFLVKKQAPLSYSEEGRVRFK